MDLAVQDRLFNWETGRWLVDSKAPLQRALFYTGPKVGIILFGVWCLLRFAQTFGQGEPLKKRLSRRKRLLTVILSILVVPTVVAQLKARTNMYCPSQALRYGGSVPYVKLFESYPKECRSCDSGRCFPGGHASGGFALMSLGFLFRRRRHAAIGFGGGMAAGWTMGGYQMLKGAHYLSHTVVTMILAWVLIQILGWIASAVCQP